MPRRHSLAAALIVAGLLTAPAAQAVTVTGSLDFTNVTGTSDTFIQTYNSPVFSGNVFTLNLQAGVQETITNFFTIASAVPATMDGYMPQNMSQTNDLAIGFGLAQPGSGSGTVTGSLTEHLGAPGSTPSGSVAWNNTAPVVLTLSDGDRLVIDLTGISQLSADCTPPAEVCGTVGATVELIAGSHNVPPPPPHHNPPPGNNNPPPPVPEPASLALLLPGLLGLGLLRRLPPAARTRSGAVNRDLSNF